MIGKHYEKREIPWHVCFSSWLMDEPETLTALAAVEALVVKVQTVAPPCLNLDPPLPDLHNQQWENAHERERSRERNRSGCLI